MKAFFSDFPFLCVSVPFAKHSPLICDKESESPPFHIIAFVKLIFEFFEGLK